jgi:hypothetical protein
VTNALLAVPQDLQDCQAGGVGQKLEQRGRVFQGIHWRYSNTFNTLNTILRRSRASVKCGIDRVRGWFRALSHHAVCQSAVAIRVAGVIVMGFLFFGRRSVPRKRSA